MDTFLFNLTVGVATCLLFLVVHVLVWRAKKEKGVLLLWSLAVLILIITVAIASTMSPLPLWGALSFFAFFLIAYTRFYITLTRTLTLRFLEELLESDRPLTPEDWERIYPAKRSFDIRFVLLKEHGWMTQKNGRCYPTAKAIRVGSGIRFLRGLYGIHHAG